MNTKLRLAPDAYLFPLPAVLLGAQVNGQPNYSTIGNCGILTVGPPIVYVSSHHKHYTNVGIREHGTYSLNVPSSSMAVVTDYCGIVSGADVDKSGVFTSFYGDLGTAPMIEECPVNLECRVIQTIELHGMEVFIAEVVGAYASEACLKDGRPDMEAVDPLIYEFSGNYWSIGREVGAAFADGHKYEVHSSSAPPGDSGG